MLNVYFDIPAIFVQIYLKLKLLINHKIQSLYTYSQTNSLKIDTKIKGLDSMPFLERSVLSNQLHICYYGTATSSNRE